MMVESEANELSEEVMLCAVMFAHRECQPVIDAIIKLAEKAAKEPWEMAPQADLSAAKKKLEKLIGKDIAAAYRSEEHTSELQSLMRISYAVFCLKTTNKKQNHTTTHVQLKRRQKPIRQSH